MVIDLIIPARNEEDAIGYSVQGIDHNLIREVIVVDNGSTDTTALKATEAGATVLTESRPGYGYACMRGIQYCRQKEVQPDIIVFMDGDGSDDPNDLSDLVAPLLQGNADMVIGSRLAGHAEDGSLTFPQIFGNRLACFLMRLFFNSSFTDLGPFRAIRFSRLLEMNLTEMKYGWTVEMQIKAARMPIKSVEVPVHYRNRWAGKSKVSGTMRGSVLAGYRILAVVFRQGMWRK
ncbi:MAG: hypothetical protein RL161_1349 [Bacteroidota bacterium]